MITLVIAPINIGLNYVLVWGPEPVNLGFVGAPIATSISLSLMSALYSLYAVFFASREAWCPLSSESFRSLDKLLRMALTGVGQSAAEWWSWEFISLAASQLGSATLASQSVLVMIASTSYQIPYALGTASSVRVGNLLGAGDVSGVALASKVAAAIALMAGLLLALTFVSIRHRLASLYSSDPRIIDLVSDALPLVATYQVLDSLVAVTGGILRACGKLGIGATSSFVGYYFIGIPLGTFLAFKQNLGLRGIWIGLVTALVFVASVLWTVVLCVDWDIQVGEASERVGDRGLPRDEEPESA